MSRMIDGASLGVVEHARDQDLREEDGVDVGGRGLRVRDDVRERDAEEREADDARRRRTRRARPSRAATSTPNANLPARITIASCSAALATALPASPAEVGGGRQRRPAQALEDPALAQRREVVGERGEGRRHDAHGGDPGDDHVEVLLAAGEDRAEDRQQPERQQDAEERRGRVAPEHPALEPELPPRRAPPGHGARSRERASSSSR